MTEREKMIAGLVYSVQDEELIRLHRACVDECVLCDRYLPSQLEERRAHLRRILGSTGKDFLIEPGFRCDYGFNMEIGENFFANYDLVVLDCAPVRFGRNCFIGPQWASIRPCIRWMPQNGPRGWNMPAPSPWATMCGSAVT